MHKASWHYLTTLRKCLSWKDAFTLPWHSDVQSKVDLRHSKGDFATLEDKSPMNKHGSNSVKQPFVEPNTQKLATY
jgi:hypothetical protein